MMYCPHCEMVCEVSLEPCFLEGVGAKGVEVSLYVDCWVCRGCGKSFDTKETLDEGLKKCREAIRLKLLEDAKNED